jgi:hypothetical protein
MSWGELRNSHEDHLRQWLSSAVASIPSIISGFFSSVFERFAVEEFAAGGEFKTH